MLPLAFAALCGLASCLPLNSSSSESLEVSKVPDYVRPYVVRAYSLEGVVVGPQIYRFPVTGPSSGNAFTLISTAAPASSELGVLPHTHLEHYENFYCLRGRYNLWASKNGSDQGRMFTAGDYGAVPHNTTHTFQITDPFTEMVGVISPGGFEDLFYFLGSANISSKTQSPYIPNSNATAAGGDSETISSLERFDVHAKLAYSPPMSFNVNGTTDASQPWHNGDNELAPDASTPFFVAKDYGSKYLAGDAQSGYLVIQPFITSTQSAGNFTEGTITLSEPEQGTSPVSWTLPGHTALEVVDGVIGIRVDGFDDVLSLSVGDVVFVPAGTAFSFWGEAAFSKVLYVGQGRDTLDSRLVAEAKSWNSPVWPA